MSAVAKVRVVSVLGVLVGAAWWSGALPAIVAQSQNSAVSFTVAQADQGQAVYAEQCASCHGQYMDDGQFGTPLKGVDFRSRWASRRVETLFSYISTNMPPERPD